MLAQILPMLERTPGVLRALLAGLPEAAVRGNYGPGTWSAYEVVGHLIVGERLDWIPRAKIVLEHGTSRAFDPFPHDATIKPESGRSLASLLDEFESLRRESLRALAAMGLCDADLARRGLHPALGEVTLGQLLTTCAAHDLHHIRQACLALAWSMRDEVGPWRAYINTFERPGHSR
ncbi:MAG: DinB family protein [Phycisphaerales bacterium]|nr:DinB family protein [Phycisphaerales bacterium]